MPHHAHVSRTTPPPAYSALLFGETCARIIFWLRALYVHGLFYSQMFLGLFPSTVHPCPNHHNKGHPRTFGPTKRVYLETIAVFPPSNLSQDPAPADALLRWLLVGSKAEESASGSSSASIGRCVPQTSGKTTLPPAEEYLYLCLYTHSHSHQPPVIHRPANDPCRACLCGAAASSSSFHHHRLAPWPARICQWRGRPSVCPAQCQI